MSHNRWSRIEELFDRVADLPPEDRIPVLERESGGDATLLREVLALLDHDKPSAIAEVIEGLALTPPPESTFEGRAIGPYRIVREIGRGGMGIVFEAIRNDGEFEKRVALKIATHGLYSDEFLPRFRNERQILAQLEHPHIARLLDGGATPEGIPFFAMEYIDGEPIDRYAETHHLPLTERIRLFLQVCEAVEYAHRHLVVHRDLKPGNILVADGFARLLDFGIAKLATGSSGATTNLGATPLTPDYCSPEQLRGEAVTARTDVYSLGLILYKLLTGEPGQTADMSSPLALDRSICQTIPVAPSNRAAAAGNRPLARQLAGDLDTIVLVSIEKDPARRYQSVSALAGDLQRYLDGTPIHARPNTALYRATRFAQRHWVGLAAVAAVILALTIGLVATAYQAQRAERRFRQVRKIANTLLDDIEVSIRELPGSVKAREVVVRTAVEYLDALLKEAGGNTALQTEVADGYVRIAGIAYNIARPSLNRPDDASRYLQQAKTILDSLHRSHPDDARISMSTIAAYRALGIFLLDTGRRADALSHIERAMELGEAAIAAHPDNPDLLNEMVFACNDRVARFYSTNDSRKQIVRHLELAERLLKLRGDSPDALDQFGLANSQAGKARAFEGDDDAALLYFRRNVDIQTKLVALRPDSNNTRRNLSIAWVNVGDLALGPIGPYSYGGAGGPQVAIDPKRRAEALEAYTKALELARLRHQKDPASDQVRLDVAIVSGRTAAAYPPGDLRAIPLLEESIAILSKLPPAMATYTLANTVTFQATLAERHRQAGQPALADAAWRSVDETYQRRLSVSKNKIPAHRSMISIYLNRAMELARRKNRTAALSLANKAEQLAREVSTHTQQDWELSGWPPRAKEWTAQVYELLGDPISARSERAAAAELWRQLSRSSTIPPRLLQEARASSEQR